MSRLRRYPEVVWGVSNNSVAARIACRKGERDRLGCIGRRLADRIRNAFGETPKAARGTRVLPKTGRRHYPRNVATQFLELL